MNTLEKDIYKKKIEKSYYLTLRDLIMGVTYEELIEDMYEFERKKCTNSVQELRKLFSMQKKKHIVK
jgi:hypothetical protein